MKNFKVTITETTVRTRIEEVQADGPDDAVDKLEHRFACGEFEKSEGWIISENGGVNFDVDCEDEFYIDFFVRNNKNELRKLWK